MTRRSSMDTMGPWALLITRSGRYRWRSRRAASSSSRNASGFGVAAVLMAVSSRGPVEDDLARVAGAGGLERGLVIAEPEAMRDRGPDVEARLEHDAHLVPGLVHLPAVDALQGQHLEHDLVDVQADLLGGDPEDGDAAAVGHRRERPPQGRRI